MARRFESPAITGTAPTPIIEEVGLPAREFLISWLLANSLAPVVSSFVDQVTRGLGTELGPLSFVLTFVLLTIPQWFVLSRYLLRLSPWEYLWRTGLGWLGGILTGAIALLGVTTASGAIAGADQAAIDNQAIVAVTIFIVTLVLGFGIGVAQWPMLARYAPGQRWYLWVAASAASFAISSSFTQLAVALGFTGPIDNIITLLVGSLLGSLITGYVLLKVLRQPVSPRSLPDIPGPRRSSYLYTPKPIKKRRKPRK